jgi:hypothetical protein
MQADRVERTAYEHYKTYKSLAQSISGGLFAEILITHRSEIFNPFNKDIFLRQLGHMLLTYVTSATVWLIGLWLMEQVGEPLRRVERFWRSWIASGLINGVVYVFLVWIHL